MSQNLTKDFEVIIDSLKPYYKPLRNCQFSYDNPLFWAGALLLFIVVSRFWELKKSFSYCAILAVILLATSRTEVFVANLFSSPGATVDTTIIKFISAFFIAMLTIFYFFVKQ
jgi:hypothetical protein